VPAPISTCSSITAKGPIFTLSPMTAFLWIESMTLKSVSTYTRDFLKLSSTHLKSVRQKIKLDFAKDKSGLNA